MNKESIISDSVEATWDVAERITRDLPPGSLLALHGDLGSGKTCFVTGVARALKINEPITSPTFTIINEYYGTKPLFHMDLYRISDPDELFSLGLDSYFNSKGITVVEWSERAGDLLPKNTIHITLEVMENPDTRCITVGL